MNNRVELRHDHDSGHPIREALPLAVELALMDLRMQGGPKEWEWEGAREVGGLIAYRGDDLLFGGKPGEAARLFAELARALAVAAYCPGGVTVYGRHFEEVPA